MHWIRENFNIETIQKTGSLNPRNFSNRPVRMSTRQLNLITVYG